MLAVRAAPASAKPVFWAAFQLTGDAAPIQLPAQ
jgi:CHAT domain-containing protein